MNEKYNWDGRILHETKSESKSKLKQSWFTNKIMTVNRINFQYKF
jgi:hypothetical protein